MKRIIALLVASVTAFGVADIAGAVTLPTTVISFTTPTKAIFGDPNRQLTITETAGTTTVTSLTPGICDMIAAKTVQILSAGTCRLIATNPGTPNFKPARSVTKTFLIGRAPNAVTISDFGWISLANPVVSITTTQTAGTTTLTSTTPTVCVLADGQVHAIKVGRCAIRATNPGTLNYLSSPAVTKTVMIAKTSTVEPPVVAQVGPWTIRQQNFDDTNSTSDTGAANSWVANGWYHTGLGYRIAQVQALSTVTMNYLVTDSKGAPAVNKQVNLSVGKRYGGSNAKVQVGTLSTTGVDKSPDDQLLVTGTTNASGIVSFAITGLDQTARAGLYTQIAAWITGLGVDTIDITNLEYSIAKSGTGGGGVVVPPVDPTLTAPSGPIDSLFYQACTGVTLFGQIANIDVDPVDKNTTSLAVTRGRSDAPSGIWDYSVLATLPKGNFMGGTNKVVTVQVYSPKIGTQMLLRLQNDRVNYNKFVQAKATTTKLNQWETLTFDFNTLSAGSQSYDPAVTYSTLALVIDPGIASTGQKYYFKNFNFPGALVSQSALTTTSTSPSLSTKAGAANGYLWAEEFNGPAKSRPNSDSWKYALDWNNFIQGTQPDLVEEDGNGNLALGMQKCSDGSWNGGIIHTLGKTAFLYGKIEARIKIASDPGWFSAFYMFGEDVAHWPTCGEFDIQESGPWTDFGSSGTIHGNYAGTTTDWNGGGGFMTPVPLNRAQLSADYHVYGLLWTPTSIAFTLDGVAYKTFTKAQVLQDGGTWPFDVPEFIVFSVYPFAASLPANAPAGTLLRGQVLVDWIHYSQYQGFGQVVNRF